jgi:hypothetical protein
MQRSVYRAIERSVVRAVLIKGGLGDFRPKVGQNSPSRRTLEGFLPLHAGRVRKPGGTGRIFFWNGGFFRIIRST